MSGIPDVEVLYDDLLEAWNNKRADDYAALFVDNGSIVGFDGSSVESAAAIRDHLASIFADHDPATYVARVEQVRPLAPQAMLLRSVVGMVPRGGDDIVPDKNAVHVVIAVETDRGWRIAHFQNTPAAYDGRPEDAAALTAQLRRTMSRS